MILFISSNHNWLFYKKKIETFYCTIFKFEFLNIYICFPFSWFHVEQTTCKQQQQHIKKYEELYLYGTNNGQEWHFAHTKKEACFSVICYFLQYKAWVKCTITTTTDAAPKSNKSENIDSFSRVFFCIPMNDHLSPN